MSRGEGNEEKQKGSKCVQHSLTRNIFDGRGREEKVWDQKRERLEMQAEIVG